MPRPTKKAKTKAAKVKIEEQVDGNIAESAVAPVAVAEAPAEVAPPPAPPEEPLAKEKARGKAAPEADQSENAATAVNIPKRGKAAPEEDQDEDAATEVSMPKRGNATPEEDQDEDAETAVNSAKREKTDAEEDKDRIAATAVNIAKLQAMSMPDLNQMARELGVENFGTMRKHEVIFHILQKNAERAGVLFSEGVLEILAEGFGFLRSQSFNYLPCPEDIDRKSVV